MSIAEIKKRYEYYKFKVEEPILDIGGGNGDFLRSQDIKKVLIIEGGNYDNEFDYLNVDITKRFPNLNKKFKTIFITETLEHLKNPLYLMAQVYDILDNDGRCYISIPYTEIGPEHHHVCRWKLKELKNQMNKLGFKIKIIQKRRRLKGLNIFYPHCWIVAELIKNIENTNKRNIECYKLKISNSNEI